MTKAMTAVHEKCLPAVAAHIDYRTLIRRSRYEQIEAEVAKLKCRLAALEGRNRLKSENPITPSIVTEVQYKSDQPPAESKTDRLNQALVNIEDDLHRILYILLQQCEMVHRKRHTKHSNVCLALKPTESRSSKGGETRKERPKLSRESRAISQPNLFSQTSEQQDAHELAASAKHIRPQSNERRSSLPRKQQKGPEICHGHYHITKPDVHWILGTSSNPSFSMMARRQIQLASLKQHGTLCMKSTPNLLTIDCAPEDRAQMISRIQTMINELQFEYDRWYRKLQFQQSVDDHSREDSAEISHLSSHLIHIMDQLVELHQLNKSFL